MAITETLKSYLVSLGYEVDSSAYTKFVSTLKQSQSVVERHTNILSSSFAKAGLAYTGAIGTIIATTATMLNSLAKADMEYEKTALRLHMTTQAAKQYSIALKVLGEPPEMLAWMPELHEHYVQLRKDAMQMELPEEYSKRMQMIRGVGQEFNRLKQESIYALQWIGFSVVKHLQGPLEKSKFTFESFNQKIIESMPRWTEKIGKSLASILKIFQDVWNVGKEILAESTKGLLIFWDSLSPTSKGLIGIGILTFLFSKLGPFGQALVMFAAVTAVASEFWSSLHGKETLLPTEAIHFLIKTLDGLARIMTLIIGLAALFWTSLTMKGEQAANVISKIGLGMKKFALWQMEKSGASKEDIAAQRADIAKHEKAVQTRQGSIQLKDQLAEVYASYASMATTDRWNKEGFTAGLVKKYPLMNLSDPERALRTKLMQKRALEEQALFQGDSVPDIGKLLSPLSTGGAEARKVSGDLPKALPKRVEKYRSIIEEASALHGVPAELIAGVIARESSGRGRPGPVVNVGKGPERAQGLMQLLPSSFGGKIITDDYENIMTGTKYLGELISKKGSVEKGLAAYGGFKTKDPTPYITDIMKYASSYSGSTNGPINSGNTYNVTVTMPIENAGGDLLNNVDPIVFALKGKLENAFREISMPSYTVSDSSGMMPGPAVNQLSVPSVSGG